eukprot:GILK01007539.1.p1 GENE.GILK01007539.1~~GILK01007539.1.p1  ORF type:complete len:660 (-),score=66.82 GILK01007539.1:116-2095(-)
MTARSLCFVLVWFCVCVCALGSRDHSSLFGGAYIYHKSADVEHFERKLQSSVSNSTQSSSLIIDASPAVAYNGDAVTVTWSDISCDKHCFIGVYAPSTSDDNDPLDFVPFTNVTSSGEHTFVVLNLGVDYQFRIIRANDDKMVRLAESNTVTFKRGVNEPLHGRLALTNNIDEMRVMWTSRESSPGQVQVGLVSGQYASFFESSCETYSSTDLCGPPANIEAAMRFRDPGYAHKALIKGLKPNTRYFYRYGSNVQGWSEEYSFVSAPLVGEQSVPTRFVIYGDMGVEGPPGSAMTMQRLSADIFQPEHQNGHGVDAGLPVQLVVHIGDLGYSLSRAFVWDQWLTMIQPVSTAVPYMVTIGNHEYDHLSGAVQDPSGVGLGFHPSWGNFEDDSTGECGVPVLKRFHMPDNGFSVWWYSFDYGMVHFTMFSTEHDFSPDSPQYRWLEKDLAAVDRTRTPWVVVGGHRAMYCSVKADDDYVVAEHMQELLEDLLHKYKVDLALWGHYHSYERTCPVYKNKCVGDETDLKATIHMVVGAAGVELDYPEWYGKEWSAFRAIEFGYPRITAINATTLHWEYVLNTNYSVIDDLWIHKQDPRVTLNSPTVLRDTEVDTGDSAFEVLLGSLSFVALLVCAAVVLQAYRQKRHSMLPGYTSLPTSRSS